jgi:hypothetical protein
MSYCRVGDEGSDVYMYADVQGGYTLHVARNRVIKGPRIKHGALKGLLRVRKINHHCAGESYNVSSREEMINLMLELKLEGFGVPRRAIDQLLDEIYQGKGRSK